MSIELYYPVKVSVCLQTYNHEAYIARALDSILMQETNFEIEIILGEDESSDGTRDICIDYAHRYPDRIRLFLRSRKDVITINGLVTGRYNFIQNLNAARGQYIALLDGDDYWTDPQKLQKQADLLDAHPEYAICFHSVDEIDDRGVYIRTVRPSGRKPAYSVHDLLKGNFIPALSVMFRNSPEHHPLPTWFQTISYADWPLHILNATHGDIGYIDEVMGVYRRHAGGITQHIYKDMDIPVFRRIEVLAVLRRYLSDRIDEHLFDEAISVLYLSVARYSADHGNLDQARAAWKQALQWDKWNFRALALLLAAKLGYTFFNHLRGLQRTFSYHKHKIG